MKNKTVSQLHEKLKSGYLNRAEAVLELKRRGLPVPPHAPIPRKAWAFLAKEGK